MGGLVRAVGMYVNTSLDMSGVDSLSIYDLTAGSALVDTDTSALKHPYQPAMAKTFHILHEHADDYGHTYYSPLIGDPRVVSASCVVGVDDIADDWDAWSLESALSADSDVDCMQIVRDDALSREIALSSTSGQTAQWLVVMIGAFACAALS